VRGTDISAGAVQRARSEASRLGAEVEFAVADMRDRALTRANLARAIAAAGFDTIAWHDPGTAVVGDQQVMTARAA
jgi:hypothetical protein